MLATSSTHKTMETKINRTMTLLDLVVKQKPNHFFKKTFVFIYLFGCSRS